MSVLAMVLVASLPNQHCLRCVWSSRGSPCNSMADCQEYNLQHIMQHASCHACVLVISISCGTSCNSSPGGEAHVVHHHLLHAHHHYHACLSAAA
jgi:hypothetical protein